MGRSWCGVGEGVESLLTFIFRKVEVVVIGEVGDGDERMLATGLGEATSSGFGEDLGAVVVLNWCFNFLCVLSAPSVP